MMQLPPHPNIVKLHAHWISDDREDMWLLLEYAPVLPALYICNIVRRYCSEGNLAQCLLSTVRLPDAALWDLAGQLLRALSVFEQHRIVHNDIKPDNIFIMAGSVPKIGDLGMARFTSAGSVLTRTPGGTPWFQAPEVLSKEMGADGRPICFPEYVACEISYQSDVYSLGAEMWSLIMDRLTFMMAIRALVLMPGLKLLQATPAMLKWRTRMRGEVFTWYSATARRLPLA